MRSIYWRMKWVAIVCIVGMYGCISSSRVAFCDTDPVSWNKGDGVAITVPNTDTTTLYRVDVVFRVDGSFACDSLKFLTKIIAPDSVAVIDSFTLYNYPTTAIGVSKSRELIAPYRTNVLFDEKGDYQFIVDCQSNDVRGVVGVGVSMTPASK